MNDPYSPTVISPPSGHLKLINCQHSLIQHSAFGTLSFLTRSLGLSYAIRSLTDQPCININFDWTFLHLEDRLPVNPSSHPSSLSPTKWMTKSVTRLNASIPGVFPSKPNPMATLLFNLQFQNFPNTYTAQICEQDDIQNRRAHLTALKGAGNEKSQLRLKPLKKIQPLWEVSRFEYQIWVCYQDILSHILCRIFLVFKSL